jgi:hypothetical protein
MTELGSFRARIADTLAAIDPDVPAEAGPTDAVHPPMYLVSAAADPWLTPSSVCSVRAQLQVLCIGGRIDPVEGGLEHIETLVTAALPALQAARIPVVQVGAVVPLEIAGIPYLVARITVATALTIGGQ